MKLDVKNVGEVKKDLKVEVGSESLKEIKKKTLDSLSKEVNISGFRKGKASNDLVEKRFPDLVKSKIIEEAVPLYYKKAVEEKKLEVVGRPQVKEAKYEGGNLSFTAQVECKPEVKIADKVYKHIKVKNEPVKVEDNEIDKYIDQMKEKVGKALDKKKEDINIDFLHRWAGYGNEEEFKKSVSSELFLNKIVQRRKDFEKQVTDHLLNKVKFALPPSVVEEQKKGFMDRQLSDFKSKGIPEEEIKKHYGELSKKVESVAKDQVKLYYILEAIVEKEQLKYDPNNIYEVVMGFILTNILK